MREVLSAYRWPLALVVLCLIFVWGTLQFLQTIMPGSARRADVTERFISSFPEVSRVEGGVLELATVQTTETFSRADEQFTAWGFISLGETVTEIRVPVTYRYHIGLSGEWKVAISGNICRVIAPPIQPSLPPAAHLGEIERRTSRGWARFDQRDQMQKVEKQMAAYLDERAGRYLQYSEVREQCRATTREFVEQWLLRNIAWENDAFHTVEVRFADETEPGKKQ